MVISRAYKDYNAMVRSSSGSGRTGPPLTGVLKMIKYGFLVAYIA